MKQTGQGNLTQVSWDAVVIRADGTREDLGTIAYWHRNPIKRLTWRLRQWLRSS